jgi:hypothetical protein
MTAAGLLHLCHPSSSTNFSLQTDAAWLALAAAAVAAAR